MASGSDALAPAVADDGCPPSISLSRVSCSLSCANSSGFSWTNLKLEICIRNTLVGIGLFHLMVDIIQKVGYIISDALSAIETEASVAEPSTKHDRQ